MEGRGGKDDKWKSAVSAESGNIHSDQLDAYQKSGFLLHKISLLELFSKYNRPLVFRVAKYS